VFNLFIFYDILQTINILSKKLQQKNTTLGKATTTINGVIQTFINMRNFSQYSIIWSKVVEFCSKHNISIEISNTGKSQYHITYYNDSTILCVLTISIRIYFNKTLFGLLVFYQDQKENAENHNN